MSILLLAVSVSVQFNPSNLTIRIIVFPRLSSEIFPRIQDPATPRFFFSKSVDPTVVPYHGGTGIDPIKGTWNRRFDSRIRKWWPTRSPWNVGKMSWFWTVNRCTPYKYIIICNHNIYIYIQYIYIWYMLLQQKNAMESSENHKNRGFPFLSHRCVFHLHPSAACLHRCATSATPRLEPQNTWGMHSPTIPRATVETHGSKVVSTHLWNTPLNL